MPQLPPVEAIAHFENVVVPTGLVRARERGESKEKREEVREGKRHRTRQKQDMQSDDDEKVPTLVSECESSQKIAPDGAFSGS